ncbi:trk system potassium uptake protein TrkA [Streptococcus rupicaprae]|uniref:Trk system potassium uptake protein TrkA n=1 Tax=Streptococcus rupicaprae TaxID=759619 RepID=A0ABV2FIP6_9STRE
MSERTIGILGLGIFGTSIVHTLKNYDCQIIAVDNREAHINAVAPYLTQGIIGDITDFELLEAAGIDTCDAVVISTGSSLEASVLAVMHCKNLGVSEVIAKATSDIAAQVLIKVGADDVISPEKEMGIAVAKQVLFPSTTDFVSIDENLSIVEFYPPESWLNHSLIEIPLRQTYQMNLIGYRTDGSQRIKTNLTRDYRFKDTERLLAVIDNDRFDQLKGLSNLK